METIEATVPFIQPLRWALLQRRLFALLDGAAAPRYGLPW
jgi:hypothetical protein